MAFQGLQASTKPETEAERVGTKDITLENRLGEYNIQEEIGQGAHGTVYRVVRKLDGKILAVKKMNLVKLKSKTKRDFSKEASLLMSLDHKYVIKCHDAFITNGYLYIVMELAEEGDLHVFLTKYKEARSHIPETLIWEVARQTLEGLVYLQSQKVIHRDIKTYNIFVTSKSQIKIGDFGVAMVMASGDDKPNPKGIVSGTPIYYAPELFRHVPYDYKIDHWAFGCVLYYLCNLKPPFRAKTIVSLGKKIVRETPNPVHEMYSKQLRLLIDKLLEKDCDLRPPLEELFGLFPANSPSAVSLRGPTMIQPNSKESQQRKTQVPSGAEEDEYSGDLEADGGDRPGIKQISSKPDVGPAAIASLRTAGVSEGPQKEDECETDLKGGATTEHDDLFSKISANLKPNQISNDPTTPIVRPEAPTPTQLAPSAKDTVKISKVPQTPSKSKPLLEFKIRNSTVAHPTASTDVPSKEAPVHPLKGKEGFSELKKELTIQNRPVSVQKVARAREGHPRWMANNYQEPLGTRVPSGPSLGSPQDSGRFHALKLVAGLSPIQDRIQQQPINPHIERAQTAGIAKLRPNTSSGFESYHPQQLEYRQDLDRLDQGSAVRQTNTIGGILGRATVARSTATAKDSLSYKLGNLIESGRPKTGNTVSTGLYHPHGNHRTYLGIPLGLGSSEALQSKGIVWMEPKQVSAPSLAIATNRIGGHGTFGIIQPEPGLTDSRNPFEQRSTKLAITGRALEGGSSLGLKPSLEHQGSGHGFMGRIQTAHHTNREAYPITDLQSRQHPMLSQNFLSRGSTPASGMNSMTQNPKGGSISGSKQDYKDPQIDPNKRSDQSTRPPQEFLKSLAQKRPVSSQNYKRLTIHDV